MQPDVHHCLPPHSLVSLMKKALDSCMGRRCEGPEVMRPRPLSSASAEVTSAALKRQLSALALAAGSTPAAQACGQVYV